MQSLIQRSIKQRFMMVWAIIAQLFLLNTVVLANTSANFGDYLTVDGEKLFKREVGCATADAPSVLLLSGPTDHWHSDSGWFALLQPLLGKSQCVWSIDRAGHGFSSASDSPSYTQFGQQLNKIAKAQNWKKITIVSFASSNISLHQVFKDENYSDWISGAVLIDPDILLPHSMAQYASDAKPFRDNLAKYKEYISAGKYAERAAQIAAKERAHIRNILPSHHKQHMDWAYYDAIVAQRQTQDRLIARFTELSQYQEDLQLAAQSTLPADLPLVIINTDFESAFIDASRSRGKAPDGSDPSEGLVKWRIEGDRWMKRLAKGKHRKYLPLNTREHLLTVSNPDIIIESVNWLLKQQS